MLIALKKAATITLPLAVVLSPLLWLGMGPAACAGLWIGVLWGLANWACLLRLTRAVVQGERRLKLAGWAAAKFVGLYGLAAWLLIGARVSVPGWLMGFTLTLAGLGWSARRTAARTAAAFAGWFLLAAQLSEASEAAHGASGAPARPPEIPNLITLITHWTHGPASDFLRTWENAIFAFVIVGIVGGLVALAARSLALLPTRGQVAAEAVVEGLDNLVCGVLGPKEGRRYLPFLGTLFLFILAMNLAGLVPGLKSPTSRFEMTGALAFCVFVYVQWTGLRRLGVVGYLDHLLGQPRDWIGWLLSPLMLFIHGIGEIVKPLSLALRLFGNIMGEDTLLGVFAVLGALTFAWSHLPIGIPLHLPFMGLAVIFSLVQALVFTSLSMIYISMMLPHSEGH